MSWFIDDELIEKEDKANEEFRAKAGIPESGVYPVEIEKAYLVKSKGGATGFEVEATELVPDNPLGGRTLRATYWIKSGDEKGNKATYTDKNGNERPLPGWIPVRHLVKVCGHELKNLKPEPAMVERFGNQEEVGVFKPLTGCKAKAVVRQYEDEYNGETRVKYDIEDWLDIHGADYKGDPTAEEKWKKTLEKNPIKKLRKKAEQKPNVTEEAKEAVSGW